MDAVSADALSARGVVLNQKCHVVRLRQRTQPNVEGSVGIASIPAKQNASNIGYTQCFRQGALDSGRKSRRKREVEPARRRSFSHVAASACLSPRIGAVLSVSVSNHAGRGAVNVRPATIRRLTAGVTRGGSKYVLTNGIAVTTLSHSRCAEGARIAAPSKGGEAGAVRGHSS